MKFLIRSAKGFFMALSMFSVIPAPRAWNDESRNMMLPMLPVIGAIIGLLWYGFSVLLIWLSPPLMLAAALIFLFPLLMSGFLHLDGLMDTSDAIFSQAELDKKRAILKDPHAGAFAVISACVYFLLGFAAAYAALTGRAGFVALAFVPALTRCVAGIAALNAKLIWESGFVASFRKDTGRGHTAAVVIIGGLCFTAGVFFGGFDALIVMGAAVFASSLLGFYSVRQLRGISGDLCGFIIAGGELFALLTLALV